MGVKSENRVLATLSLEVRAIVTGTGDEILEANRKFLFTKSNRREDVRSQQ